ncbi:MAG TPA: STM3941 family protein [Dinghuibacter sp.]|uniref:STM3941 family protein n=1 Tax=Dinghuibacter sp. TaxID=2024697 RepID=UPI002C19B052|nr:STM3941 family protein [Dinghuibacter sp.]HTJ14188.1 STM3941 family protein [Dinghuibacter sp.]
MEGTISIPYNRWLVAFFSLVWVIAVAIGAPLWLRQVNVGFFGFLLCLLVYLYYLVRRLILPVLRGRPALELTPEGLEDNIKGVRVSWGNIAGFTLIRVGWGSNYIRVDLEDTVEFFEQVENPIRAWLHKRRQNMTGSPFVIPTTLVQGNDQVIFEKLVNYKKSMS